MYGGVYGAVWGFVGCMGLYGGVGGVYGCVGGV